MSKIIPEYLDRLGRTLNIDDCVVTNTPYVHGLSIAKVIGFTPKMVKVVVLGSAIRRHSEFSRYSTDTVIIDPAAVTYYLLAKVK